MEQNGVTLFDRPQRAVAPMEEEKEEEEECFNVNFY
jgi:hypothetical protein